MTGEESVFSFIKQPDLSGGAAQRGRSGVPPPAPPPPAPARTDEKLAAKIAELEAKIKALEGKDPGPGQASVDGLKTELQDSQRRVSGLESALAGLQKALERAGEENHASKQVFDLAMGRFRDELSVLRLRDDSAEELRRALSLANEKSIKAFETGVVNELKERLQDFYAVTDEASRKAGLACESSAASALRTDKFEERLARLACLESRFESIEKKLEKVAEIDFVKRRLESAEKNIEKIHELGAVTTRLESAERKLEKLYDLDATVQVLKVNMENIENKFSVLIRDTSCLLAEHKNINSDFESVSRQVKQLTALFNYFRTELSFLLPKKKESVGEHR